MNLTSSPHPGTKFVHLNSFLGKIPFYQTTDTHVNRLPVGSPIPKHAQKDMNPHEWAKQSRNGVSEWSQPIEWEASSSTVRVISRHTTCRELEGWSKRWGSGSLPYTHWKTTSLLDPSVSVVFPPLSLCPSLLLSSWPFFSSH